MATSEDRPANRCKGPAAIIRSIVVQLGLAMIPRGRSLTAWSFTWATTSGTSGSIRKAEELSTTTAPAAANAGAKRRERSPPAEKRAMSTPAGSDTARSSTSIFPHGVSTLVPAERSEAKRRRSSAGNPRSTTISSMVRPTAPVAPTIASLMLPPPTRSWVVRMPCAGSVPPPRRLRPPPRKRSEWWTSRSCRC